MKFDCGNNLYKIIFIGVLIAALVVASGCADKSASDKNQEGSSPSEASGASGADKAAESGELTLTDGFGREVTIPESVEQVVCSGAGCLRYLVYLQAQDYVVGVDSIEKEKSEVEGRPYVLANPQLKDYPLIGEFRGKDDPEKIIAINPQVILKTSASGQPTATNSADAEALQNKTGIPVVMFPYGSLKNEEQKAQMYSSLRIMGKVVDKQERAEEIINYINATMKDLENRTADIPESERKTVYVGGVSSAGAHGIISTEPAYAPFLWVNAKNVAAGMGTDHADIAKEALVDWDPEYIFIDVGTLQLGNEGAVGELKNDTSLAGLSAVKNKKVYGVIPYNFYSTNYESVLVNAYFIGKVLYPDRFKDIDPESKADEIYTFFLGKPLYSEINGQYGNLGFKAIPI
ncbi:iron ABC transporter substrate-binding protein [Methanosarcina sp.]|uniref:iron ABC transporter substrate-binding protein n=1 Tax=Methanosarcina sp. TaxID=2213 RepID=UPI00298897B2|nr:iron ABC transporter substrate-binding protein [Methanosarcina sp.]MDW5549098.1 iron ABC transporter substrate-binding protein [Methanosarcina sp.]MDW5553168.1 iron ABC transporter substrate-binding protein [Methanosarcina sp.]MDW5559306.1 iron ABC transporter substrate-binding protein [Methanosarcina sp.]